MVNRALRRSLEYSMYYLRNKVNCAEFMEFVFSNSGRGVW